MTAPRKALSILILLLALAPTAAAALERMEWTVDGLQREALVYLPPAGERAGAPVVFAFHGHGGRARGVARKFRLHELWPEAFVVYMQGVPTPGRLSDPEGRKAGWQHDPEAFGGRDLAFFDAVLATLREDHGIDERRVYATGHSNGGGFCYLLWVSRPGVLAAIAPSAAGSSVLRQSEPEPLPVMHIAGANDTVVRYEWQKATMRRVCEINRCGRDGQPWADACLSFATEQGARLVTCTHDGTHQFPSIAPELIVRFFREEVRR
jgi:polyhydroxybutyrate depolymerase